MNDQAEEAAKRSDDDGAVEAAKTRLARLLEWWKQTRVARGLARYGATNGALLTGGIAYSALFSIFAGLAVAFSIFMAIVGDNEGMQEAVLAALDSALPGVVQSETNSDGMLTPESLRFSGGASLLTGVIGFVVLINAAISVMAALRAGIRAMFGIVTTSENAVVAKLRDLAGFVVLALAVVLTAGLGIAVGTAGTAIADAVGLGDNPAVQVLLRIAGYLVALAVDLGVVVFLIRGLAGARPPRRDLLTGALVVAVAAGVIRFLGTSIVGGAASNPLLAPYAAIITLLLWVNFIVRILLMVCAWTANPPAVPEVEPGQLTHEDEAPNYVTETDPDTLAWDHDPSTGRIRPAPAPDPEREEYWGGLIGWIKRKYRGFRDA
ncbi:YihY/virulence factor BrkB family protein [Pseudactinotalea terrae]|uniref:YihY/virulence factor BrkB family protein n=1 Tax=Pseudactinotalea terrae TaxID=1743262 RepID=UPI0012E321E5|nr:YihY/virulence factor BrkB family protein [Pseudactinotalea terrae]